MWQAAQSATEFIVQGIGKYVAQAGLEMLHIDPGPLGRRVLRDDCSAARETGSSVARCS